LFLLNRKTNKDCAQLSSTNLLHYFIHFIIHSIEKMWEDQDKQTYTQYTQDHLGQICNDDFAKDIESYAADPCNKTFLEIGTWNGLGSTRAFANGFKLRPSSIAGLEDDYTFYSLECNHDKCVDAASLYTENPRIHILNEVVWNEEPPEFYHIFPECLSNERLKLWHTVDMANMKKCSVFLDRPDLPAIFDVVLLDGGEFTTYFDFQLLKDRCRILMLDDVNASKCKLIVRELYDDPSWQIVKRMNLRGGYLIAEKSISK